MPTMGLMEGILLAGVVVAAGGTAATSVMGAVSSLSTTTGREQGNTNLRGGFADELSRLSSLSAQYANKYDKIGRNTKNLQSIFQGVTSIAGAAVSAGGGMKQFGANIKSGAYSWS